VKVIAAAAGNLFRASMLTMQQILATCIVNYDDWNSYVSLRVCIVLLIGTI